MTSTKVIAEKDAKMLHRKEITLEVPFDKITPSIKEALAIVVHHKKATEDLVVIKSVKNVYGTHLARISAYVYDSTESRAKIEPKPKVKKAEEGEAK